METTTQTTSPEHDAATRVQAHRVYASVRGPASLRAFLEHHAICVLDFMTLLKRLQAELTCVGTPWVPPADPVVARLINEIVVDEESDAAFGTEPRSHYGWYLAAMDEVGADTGPIRDFEARLRAGVPPLRALSGCGLPAASVEFARTTFELAAEPLHVVAAAFVHGRESVIPAMFIQLVRELRAAGVSCDLFARYLERHVEVDSDEHGPAARQLLARLVAGDATRQAEAEHAAERALLARERLWDETALACERAED